MHHNILACCALLFAAGCAGRDARKQPSDSDAVAVTFAETAGCVYRGDWGDFDEPVTALFATEQLRILGDHLLPLQSMIETALGSQGSVCGAKLAGHFKMYSVLPLLRRHFLMPRVTYGWEGPDYSQLESYLEDRQYPYSVAYLEAIEQITGKRIAEAIVLTQSEANEIQKYAGNEDSEFHHWDLWMQRKLKLKEKANEGIDHDRK